MGLFSKKVCDICGNDIGLLGNRKLSDGNCCKNCASLLSPWMTDRKQSTVEEIKEHIAYREANAKQLPGLQPTRIFGNWSKIYIDDNAGCFFVTNMTDWKKANPDIVYFDQVADVKVDIDEYKHELYDKDKEGKQIRFDPPRFEFSYSFDIVIYVNSPYFDVMRFTLSDKKPESRDCPLYFDYERQADEIRMTLMPGCEPIGSYIAFEAEMARREAQAERMRDNIAGAAANLRNVFKKPAQVSADAEWVCKCGTKNSGNFCANCGAAKAEKPKVIRCDKCGWTSPDGQIPKFCPQCGDPITLDDIK